MFEELTTSNAQTENMARGIEKSPGARLTVGLPADVLDTCWVAYVDQGMPWVLQSSYVILVSKSDGRVVYQGSVHDEG